MLNNLQIKNWGNQIVSLGKLHFVVLIYCSCIENSIALNNEVEVEESLRSLFYTTGECEPGKMAKVNAQALLRYSNYQLNSSKLVSKFISLEFP